MLLYYYQYEVEFFKSTLHTGDFRGHGYMGNGIYKVIDKFHIAGNVDILITEGTNVDNNAKSMMS